MKLILKLISSNQCCIYNFLNGLIDALSNLIKNSNSLARQDEKMTKNKNSLNQYRYFLSIEVLKYLNTQIRKSSQNFKPMKWNNLILKTDEENQFIRYSYKFGDTGTQNKKID
ncbi:unnamed protein product [Paramecium pentaurelia]|uniref:Uncharacterized protein n=1 Tax=Paramecium pentaurelia TaxID=43138 RepID=A0A8S1W4E4_9CILI|nr:unnamed protein product [Paramecium pentaurelia]